MKPIYSKALHSYYINNIASFKKKVGRLNIYIVSAKYVTVWKLKCIPLAEIDLVSKIHCKIEQKHENKTQLVVFSLTNWSRVSSGVGRRRGSRRQSPGDVANDNYRVKWGLPCRRKQMKCLVSSLFPANEHFCWVGGEPVGGDQHVSRSSLLKLNLQMDLNKRHLLICLCLETWFLPSSKTSRNGPVLPHDLY